MTAIKKFNLLMVSLLLAFAGCFLFACGGPSYSKVTVTPSEQALFIDKGEEREITFTINNFASGMSNYLAIDNNGPDIVSFERGSTNANQTTIRVKGERYGTAVLTATQEGSGKSCEVKIVVSEYADTFSEGADRLYISESTPFVPSPAQFNLEGGNKRDLDFYFYGITAPGVSILPTDIQIDGEYTQKFDSVELISQDGKHYLIFNDGNNLFTLSTPDLDYARLGFMPAQLTKTQDGEGNDVFVYEFEGSEEPYDVPLGQEFTFAAIYRGAEESGIENYFCQRKFTALGDIPSTIEYSYFYTNKQGGDYQNEPIKLIPLTGDGSNAYQSVTLQVKIPGAAALSDKAFYDNNIFKVEEGEQRGENGVFSYVITSAAQDTTDGVLTLKFFYDGLESISDESVNKTVNLDVKIIFEPEKITINGVESGEGKYTFYDRYNGDDGWQPLQINLTPNDAVFDTLTIEFDDSVEIRENGLGSNIESGHIIHYRNGQDIKLEIRGSKECAEGQVNFTLNYNIVENKSLTYVLNYEVKKGADQILATDEGFLIIDDDEKGIFLASDIDEPVIFTGLYANQEFGFATARLVSGEDVVSIGNDARIACDTQHGNALSMQLLPKKTGVGHYIVTLDNGIWREIVIRVVDSFAGFELSTTEKNVTIENITENSDTNFSADAFVLNSETFGRIVTFNLSTGSANVISDAKFGSVEDLKGFERTPNLNVSPANLSFTISTISNGTGYLTLQFRVSSVQDFKLVKSDTITYRINITSYSPIRQFIINKTSDGHGSYTDEQANYVYVYHNTENHNSRTATFASPESVQGFLFINPAWIAQAQGASKYLYQDFSLESIYWTTDLSNQIMYYDPQKLNNTFEIGRFGTFDAQNMTFTAYSYATNAQFTLIGNVMQLERPYSFSINIKIEQYVNVANISLSTVIDEGENGHLQLYFSPNGDDDHQELIVTTVGEESKIPTNPSISAIYTPKNGDSAYNFFDMSGDGISLRSDGSYLIKVGSIMTELDGANLIYLDLKEDFISFAREFEGSLTGTFQIVADDWLNLTGSILPQYSQNVITIDLNYQNGTKENPFYLADAIDVASIKDAPNDYYILARRIDISSLKLPICADFSGTITGTKDYAEIIGFTINNDSKIGDNYGLFGTISGTINNVKFSGHINVEGAENANIGLVAGQNNGNLINIGLTTDSESRVSGSGNFGLVVGVNDGLIAQDYQIYSDATENNIFYGLNPRTLLFSEYDFIVYQTASANVGGVTGLNSGKIFKYDNDSLSLLNYGNYLAYALIKVYNSTESTKAGVVAGQASGSAYIAGGNTKPSNYDAPKIVGQATVTDGKLIDMKGGYKVGAGILVGGSVTLNSNDGNTGDGLGYAGGIVGQINVGENTSFYGITSRVYVRGGSANTNGGNVGAIAGDAEFGTDFLTIYTNNFDQEGSALYSPFGLQAVDDGFNGIEASMVVVTLASSPSEAGSAPNINAIGFGSSYSGKILSKQNEEESHAVQNVFTYSKRTKNQIDGTALLDTNESSDNLSYFGDYIIVAKTNQTTKIYAQDFFELGVDATSIRANENFAHFDNENIFYAFYFAIASSVSGDSSLENAQLMLDKNFNTVASGSPLYPFVISGDLQLSSLSSNIVSIDEMGLLSISSTGLASLRVSSLLNRNEHNDNIIYLKCTNYFNTDENTSIIYQTDNLSIPVGQTEIDLQGNRVVNFVVRPDYTLIDDQGQVFDKSGSGNIGGVVITLAGNNDIELCAEIDKYTKVVEGGENEIYTRDGETGELKNGDLALDEKAGLIPLDGNKFGYYGGQTLSIMRDNATEQGIFNLHLWTRISATVNDETYYAAVNRNMYENDDDIFTKVVYTPGAENMKIGNSSLPIYTSEEMQTYVIITSKSIEPTPLYRVYDEEGVDVTSLFSISMKIDERYNRFPEQKFNLVIRVNKESEIYKNRANQDIYKEYLLTITARSNTDVFKNIKLTIRPSEVSDIIVDNYKTENATSPTEVALAGQKGYLAINIQPYDADFDYFEITSAIDSSTSSNVSARFNLVAKNKVGVGGYTQSNLGTTLTNGLRLTQKQIVDFYASQDNGNELYNLYNGMFYLSYILGTEGVIDGGEVHFNFKFFKNGVMVKEKLIALTIELQYHVNITLNAESTEEGKFDVARGQDYRLELSYYGFEFDDITLNISSQDSRYISKSQDGSAYIIHVNDEILYADGKREVSITANAYQKEGDLERRASDTIRLNIHEFVVRQNPLSPDFVEGMDGGIIHVQVNGNLTLAINPAPIIDYNDRLTEVVGKVRNFVSDLAQNGEWIVYTNLNSSGYPPLLPQKADENSTGNYSVTLPKNDESNFYFTASGLNVTPIVTHDYFNGYYYFKYLASYLPASDGIYQVIKDKEINQSYPELSTTFTLDVYQSSSLQTPMPVENAEQLFAMEPNSHYRQVADITLPEDFEPITTQIASFDGNGYTIFYEKNLSSANEQNGVYDFVGTNIGLFENIQRGTLIKNVTIALKNDVEFYTSGATFSAGLLAGNNNGNITNCYAYSGDNTLSVSCLDLTADAYSAGLVGRNSGYITNSRAQVNIKSNFSIGGLVGQNTGVIASSFVKNVILDSGSNLSIHHVGGLAVVNNQNGRISTSYVSGEMADDRAYSYDKLHYLKSTQQQAGFVHTNLGSINDCYSNIYNDIENVTSNMAGFVYTNSGTIRNAFSLSVLKNNRNSSAGFVYESEGNYHYENCYYFYNNPSELENSYQDDGQINTTLHDRKVDGVDKLNKKGFESLAENFAEYAYSDNPTTTAVWCYSNNADSMRNLFAETQLVVNANNPTKPSTQKVYTTFNTNRLELVAPNILAFTSQVVDRTVTDEASGDVTYHYKSVAGSGEGTATNPVLIEDAEMFENCLVESSSLASSFNNQHYRLVCDINYSGININSQLYKVTYYGVLEGNGMRINNISLMSTDQRLNAGLFGQIGRDADHQGTVMNLKLAPAKVTFVNTNCVGALAGTLTYGSLYNIEVTKYTSDDNDEADNTNLVVQGKNFVGGVVGRALNSFNIKNVTSNVSAVSNYKPDGDQSYSSSASILGLYSYAGGVIGYAGGSNGRLQKLYANDITDLMGDRVGVVLGGIGNGTTADYLYANLSDGLDIKAYSYAGLAVGEVKGDINHVQVGGAGNAQPKNFFNLIPEVPTAVGGIAGILSGGKIENAYMDQLFSVNNLIVDRFNGQEQTINVGNVGGIVGMVANGSDSILTNCIVNVDITAVANYVGGIIGQSLSGVTLNNVVVHGNVNLKLSAVDAASASARLTEASIGGFIGSASGNVVISNSYSLASISVLMHGYDIELSANVGHFLGTGQPSSMDFVYSTGKIDVTLADKRQTTEDLTSVLDGGGESANYRYIRNLQEYDNVYFYGIGSYSDRYEELQSGMTTFKQKALYYSVTMSGNYLGNATENVVSDFNALNLPQSHWDQDSATDQFIPLQTEKAFTWLSDFSD